GGELGRVEESGGVVGGAFGQVLDLVQVPPAHGGDLTGGGVDLSGDGGLEQLPDVTGAAGAAASAGVEPAHGGLGQVDHGQADFLGDLGLGGRLVAGVLIEAVSGDRGDPGRGGVAVNHEQLPAMLGQDQVADAGGAAVCGGPGGPPGRPAQGGAPRAVTRSGEHQVGDQEADEDAGGHPQYGGQTGRPLSGPVALIGVGGIQERRDDGGDAAHGQSSWPVDVHDRYHSPLMWWVRASQGWDTPVPPRPPAHERPEQGGGTPERPRL